MKLSDEIDREEENETPVKEKAGDLFFAMLNGKTFEETVSTSKGDFVLKFPKQKDIIAIARIAAYMRSGIPYGSFDAAGEYEIQKISVLDVMVESGPSWFNKIRKTPNFSWKDVPDASFVDEVYAKALSFRREAEERIRGIKKTPPESPVEEVSGDIPANVGDDVFSDIAVSAAGSGS
ncbi:MAG: hypothetical protein LBL64_10015 [Treponema sp.]|jgi:hypothetical protein|nr:hypothetical protein [Treponema sp.]